LRAEGVVLKREGFAIGHAKAPVNRERVGERWEWCIERGTKLRWVNRFVVVAAFMRGADGIEHIAARAGTGKDHACGVESGEGGTIKREALALGYDGFLPGESQPAQVFEHRVDEIESESDSIKIVVAQ
jgi:hypothetical protein